jgi:hypothetical protein
VLAAPLEDVGAIEAPDGHAGGGDAVLGAEFRARLPAVGHARRRVLEEDHKLVEEREGWPSGSLAVWRRWWRDSRRGIGGKEGALMLIISPLIYITNVNKKCPLPGGERGACSPTCLFFVSLNKSLITYE